MFGKLLVGLLMSASCIVVALPSPPVVRMIVPYAVGGGVDVVARMTAEAMQHALGSNVVVENRPGAGGVLANSMVAKSAPDGSMILVSGPSIAIQPQLFSSLPYDPIGDLVSAGGILQSPNVLVVKSDSSIKNLKSLVQRAERQPDLTYGSAGIATPATLRWSI